MERVELRPSAVVAGGDAIARDDAGRVVFVEGALPDERVIATITEQRKDFRRATTVDVVEPSPDRVAPPCPKVALGCGGCGWQHVAVGAQHRLKTDMVRDALARIAKLAVSDLPEIRTVALPVTAFRTTVRVAVDAGRASFHRARSNELVDATGCLVAHPLVAEILDEGRFGDASEAIVRVGVSSGERAVLLRPTASGDVRLPDDVEVVDDSERSRGAPGGFVHETIRGRTLRASIRSFFQASPQAAEALVGEVVATLQGFSDAPVGAVADLYAGVGLFASALVEITEGQVVAVERDRWSFADAVVNLASTGARVVRRDVGLWRPGRRFDAVVADPARPGLGRPGVATLQATGAQALVLVSCDVASFARDVHLLAETGLALRSVTLVDAFPQTPHVEVVSSFTAF